MDILKIKNELEKGRTIFDLPLSVGYYTRVSTDKEDQLNSLDNQISYFEDYIRKNKNWKFAGGYVDEGLSGASTKKRKSFLQMIKDGKNKKFDLIITKEISRFSRNTLDSIKYTQELLHYGIGIYFQSDNINTFLPDAELRLTIMASIAQDEVRKLSERVKFGFKRAIDNGKVLGQNNMMGYDKKNGILTINEKEADIIKKIFEIYVQGNKGLRAIAREFEKEGIVDSNGNMISYGSMHNILTNPKYKGFYCGKKYFTPDYRDKNRKLKTNKENWIIYKDENIPAIVSEEIWDEANRIISERGKKFKDKSIGHQNRYKYSGKIFCAEHGTGYNRHIYKSKKGDKEVWNCRLYRLKGKKDGCDSQTIYSSELDYIMNEIFFAAFKNKDKLLSDLLNIYFQNADNKDYQSVIVKKNNEIKLLYAKKDKLLELLMGDHIKNEEFVLRNDKFNNEIENFKIEINNIEREMQLAAENNTDMMNILNKVKNEFIYGEIYNQLSSVILDKIIINKNDNKNHINLQIFLKTGETFISEYIKKDGNIIEFFNIDIYPLL